MKNIIKWIVSCLVVLSLGLAGSNMSVARAQAEFTETVTTTPTQTAIVTETATSVQVSNTPIPTFVPSNTSIPSETAESLPGKLLTGGTPTPAANLASSNILASTVLSAGTYNENHASITYTSKWASLQASQATNGTYKQVNSYGEKASLAFNGNKLTVIYTKSPSGGWFQVTIDGANYYFGSYSTQTQHQAQWASPALATGSHNAVIQNINRDGKITILDGLIISGSTSAPLPTSMPTNASAASSNQVPNSGFETAGTSATDAANWTEGTNHTRTSDKFHTGGWSLRSTFRGTGTTTRTRVPIAVSPNTTYTYSGYIWRANSTGGACLDMADIVGERQLCASTSGSWQFLSGTWNSGTNTSVILRLITDGSPTGDIWFDNITLVGTTGPTAVPTNMPTSTRTPTKAPTQAATAAYTPTWTPTKAPTNTATAAYTPTQIPTIAPTNSATGASYYVSSSGNSADGKSWATAWKGLSQINWSVIRPGDTIYISGGTTSATYTGGIQVSKAGTASKYITIDTGANSPSPAGHNGTVIIEGGSQCFLLKGSYIKLRNIACQHATDDGIRIEGTGMILENNTIRETYGQGIHVTYCTGCIVRWNRITSFPNDGAGENRPYQTDGIVAYDSTDTLIEGNWIKLTNQYASAHIDGIQASTNLGKSNKNITIRYNYVENTKAATSNSQGIYMTQMQGDVKMIGNIVVVPIGGQAVASHLFNNSPVNVYVIGNTIKNGGYWALHIEDDNPVIKNNIVWQTGGADPYIKNGALVRLVSWAGSASNIDNNLLYAPYNSTSTYSFYMGSSATSWSSWQAKGFNSHGMYGQNLNLDSCLRPISTSPAIGKAAILADEYAQGLSISLCASNGPNTFLPLKLNNRNQSGGSAWDIGAYELE